MPKLKKDYLLLKWGTLKGWNFENSPKALKALKEYGEKGMSFGAAMQNDTEKQKDLICDMIDGVNGPVINDWEGEEFDSKEDAKKYVRDYGNK